MRLPLPKNKLVMLTLVGALVAAGASVALAIPDLAGPHPAGLPDGAPADDPNFQPAVQSAPRGEYEDDEDENEWEWFSHAADEADEH